MSKDKRGLLIGRAIFNLASDDGKEVGFNPNLKTGGLDVNGKNTRPTYIGLGHELAHIQDTWEGVKDKSEWFSYTLIPQETKITHKNHSLYFFAKNEWIFLTLSSTIFNFTLNKLLSKRNSLTKQVKIS